MRRPVRVPCATRMLAGDPPCATRMLAGDPSRATRMLAGVALAVVALATGCGREPSFPDRVARVTTDGRTVAFTLDSCGLDGQTAFLVGRAESGATLQAVVGVEPDGETGVPASSGITVLDFDTVSLSAFGDEAWARRGETSDAPGSIETARIRGARIQASGRAAVVDRDEVPTGDELLDIRLDARCDADEEG
ncbi:hypothetical protein HC251_23530 [Iamia sp. SCSIO 61187]|uniref:hypothetical protein n=1 Tax=Iamia sp. SCSIO 61187 TaxID=2722752 RepID=UPI001C635971|nr:hypothetical protein [Iamia sp. SCSIO 61187]QYG95105.1 hypothetical protein HC251_23530 [Iamia sp. SCSIO 61187]